MNLKIFTDESGVFDPKNNKFYILSGILILNKKDQDRAIMRYKNVENNIKKELNFNPTTELKAYNLKPKNKRRLLNIMKNYYKFAIVIDLNKIYPRILENKFHKQAFQDYAYSRGVKEFLLFLENKKIISLNNIKSINFFLDERPVSSSGRYELESSLYKELKIGKYNENFLKFREGIIPNIQNINLQYLDSKNNYLIRASDILANIMFYCFNSQKNDFKNKIQNLQEKNNLFIIELP